MPAESPEPPAQADLAQDDGEGLSQQTKPVEPVQPVQPVQPELVGDDQPDEPKKPGDSTESANLQPPLEEPRQPPARAESNGSTVQGSTPVESPTKVLVESPEKDGEGGQFDEESFESTESSRTTGADSSQSTASTGSNLEELLEHLKLDTDDARLVSSLSELLGQSRPAGAPAELPNGGARLPTLDLDGVASFLQNDRCRNVIVMVGAGISTSAGIPDFRSPDSGIYSKLAKYNLPSPECMFEINYFKKNPYPFFELARELFNNQKYRPTPCHYFIRLLQEKRRLLRLYTQNIDGLEFECGMPEEAVITAHGSFNKSRCLACGKEYDFEFIKRQVYDDPAEQQPVQIPRCTPCRSATRNIIKPNIVFFGERLPADFYEMQDLDFPKCDLLLVIGTSLSVQPFAGLIDQVRPEVPRVLINREKRGECSRLNSLIGIKSGLEFDTAGNYRDVFLQGDCDAVCLELIEKLGWTGDYEKLAKPAPTA